MPQEPCKTCEAAGPQSSHYDHLAAGMSPVEKTIFEDAFDVICRWPGSCVEDVAAAVAREVGESLAKMDEMPVKSAGARPKYWCPKCERGLTYSGDYGAPGKGSSYSCPACGRNWAVVGGVVHDPRDGAHIMSVEEAR